MLGYDDWIDVRNDLLLLGLVLKLGSLCYIVHDWWVFHQGGSSSVLFFVWRHTGWDSPVYAWVKAIWMLGR